jgi:hypothetical protein
MLTRTKGSQVTMLNESYFATQRSILVCKDPLSLMVGEVGMFVLLFTMLGSLYEVQFHIVSIRSSHSHSALALYEHLKNHD